jgi:hypothetical protein
VKHYIKAGVDPQTVMKWSGHRTMSMLLRYLIIDLDDLRRAGKKASDYAGPRAVVTPLRRTAVTVRLRRRPTVGLPSIACPLDEPDVGHGDRAYDVRACRSTASYGKQEHFAGSTFGGTRTTAHCPKAPDEPFSQLTELSVLAGERHRP